jgi:ubiquinone/menaquinone biosynthesis C-methylase UbiE
MPAKVEFNLQQSKNFNQIVKNIFAPIYPVIVDQAIKKSGKTEGNALDLGSGPAHLAIALAKKTDLHVVALDFVPDIYKISKQNIREQGLLNRVTPLIGDVHEIPVRDSSFDLIVSRGSIFFWKDKTRVFKEAWRILKPGGKTFIGGGFGNAETKARVFKQMAERQPEWHNEVKDRMQMMNNDNIRSILADALIKNHEIIRDDSGFWIVLDKI